MRLAPLSRNNNPQMYAFACFDNAVRLAYYLNAQGDDVRVVGGNNQAGVHYAVYVNDSYYLDADGASHNPFVDGVVSSLSLQQAVGLRRHLANSNQLNVYPPYNLDDNCRDGLCALAPDHDLANSFSS